MRKRIEVCRALETAEKSALWMREREYEVEDPVSVEKVIWVAQDVTGNRETASDEDGEVWMVIGTKG